MCNVGELVVDALHLVGSSLCKIVRTTAVKNSLARNKMSVLLIILHVQRGEQLPRPTAGIQTFRRMFQEERVHRCTIRNTVERDYELWCSLTHTACRKLEERIDLEHKNVHS